MNKAVTPEKTYLNRREIIKYAGKVGLITGLSALTRNTVASSNSLQSEITDFEKVTNYNNFYEFSTNKQAVAELAKALTTTPWPIECSGLIEKPTTIDAATLISSTEYIYRFRCVEGWSMVVPWQGIQLKKIIEQLAPLPAAKYVKFSSIYRPSEMIGQRKNSLEWPYTEALRLDEATHPLTILATGMYGKPLPKQNGAPVRLVVPWKYGFKSIKSIAKIEFLAEQPTSTWMQLAPEEYGFYANVNPKVAHPRWSQRRELRLGELKKRKTLLFNGYEKQVEHLYKGMDLAVHY